jgi:hypothetical protein
MSQHLAESKRQRAKRRAPSVCGRYSLSESELMREIASAVRAETRRVKVSESEAEALAQTAAERVHAQPARAARSRARGARFHRPRRAYPTLTAERREGIPRGEIGRNYIATIVSEEC